MNAPDFTWAWEEPLLAAAHYTRPETPFVFLHSALLSPGARYSHLALDPVSICDAPDWAGLGAHLHALPEEARLFGYAGYELGEVSSSPFPAQWWMRPRTRLRFDHQTRRIEGWGPPPVRHAPSPDAPLSPSLSLTSNFSAGEYKDRVARILEDIRAGEYYQANLTRKFRGRLHGRLHGRLRAVPNALPLFARFCAISPAPYAALIHTPDWQILSASMEAFVSLEAGHLSARPIKGTSPRGATPEQDAALAEALRSSDKDRAENIMIVDLMRHDFAQSCEPGSVRASGLCALESYAQLHHLVSTIEGRLRGDASVLDALRACFPPGSMTGAPKRASMRRLAELEAAPRGPYAGMLGWLGKEAAQTSVIIRTLLLRGAEYEFQVGGGIVQDSDPETEWRETLVKAQGLARLLGIENQALADL